MYFRRGVFFLVAALLVSGLLGPTQAQPQALSAPVLKWAYGGCDVPPHWCDSGWYASPAVVDLDGDLQPEVIWGPGDLFAVNGENGLVQWSAEGTGRIWPGIAVADLTGDGSLEVIVGRGGNQVTVYDNEGDVVWTRSPFSGGEVRTLAVTDLESDGVKEVIVGRASSGGTEQVSVYEAGGAVRAGWPARHASDPGYSAGLYNENITVADLNGDGFKEIFAPNDTHYILGFDRSGNQLEINDMYAPRQVWGEQGVHVDHAADLRGFANCGTEHRPNFANAAPAIADMDNDGTLELVVLGDVYNCQVGDPTGDMYNLPWIFRMDRTRWSNGTYDWTVIPAPAANSGPRSQNWEVIETTAANTVIADLDGDGEQEIIYPSYDGRIHAYWLDKTQHGSWPFDVPGSTLRFASEPAVADLDNDGHAELIFTSWPTKASGQVGQLHVLSYLGQQLFAVNLPAPGGEGRTWNGGLGAPTIANIDADPDLEAVVGTRYSGIVAYDLPGSAQGRVLWGTGRGSYERTGVAPTITLRALPRTQRVEPGGSASYTLKFEGLPDTQLTLAAGAVPGLEMSLTPATVTTPGEATLVLTDTNPVGSDIPPLTYTVPITASGGGTTQTMNVRLLVGGRGIYLPLTRR